MSRQRCNSRQTRRQVQTKVLFAVRDSDISLSTYIHNRRHIWPQHPAAVRTSFASSRSMAASISTLLRLPPELIFEINSYLPPDATLALKLTHSVLNNTLPWLSQLRNKDRSSCARFAVERLCAPSYGFAHQPRCFCCNVQYPADMFLSSSSPACKEHPRGKDVAVVELPPYLCSWHVGRLVRDVATESNGRNEWVSSIRRMCIHDSCISGWSDCKCTCDSCGYVTVRTYTRYRSDRRLCSRYQFWRNTAEESVDPQENGQGRLYVREIYKGTSESLLNSQPGVCIGGAHCVLKADDGRRHTRLDRPAGTLRGQYKSRLREPNGIIERPPPYSAEDGRLLPFRQVHNGRPVLL